MGNTIIVRRKKRAETGSHGGAWKIAYADFVTAMMAFFLLMWLLSSSSPTELQGIAEYFKDPRAAIEAAGKRTSNSESLIPGGGDDLTKQDGEDLRTDSPFDEATSEEDYELERMEALKREIEALIKINPKLLALKDQILIDITSEGLRIQLIDKQNRPMFALSSDQLHSYAIDGLHALVPALNTVPNRLSLSGHTDAKLYPNGEREFSNWELSANRANASRRELVQGGIHLSKIARVVGLSDSVPFNGADPLDAANRRISIIVMNRRTDRALQTLSTSRSVTPELLSKKLEAPAVTPSAVAMSSTSSATGKNIAADAAPAPEDVKKLVERLNAEKI